MTPPAFTVMHELHPRFRDTDAMGHINNAVYVTYLEVARQEYWRAFTGAEDYRREPFILAHVTIDFRSEGLTETCGDEWPPVADTGSFVQREEDGRPRRWPSYLRSGPSEMHESCRRPMTSSCRSGPKRPVSPAPSSSPGA